MQQEQTVAGAAPDPVAAPATPDGGPVTVPATPDRRQPVAPAYQPGTGAEGGLPAPPPGGLAGLVRPDPGPHAHPTPAARGWCTRCGYGCCTCWRPTARGPPPCSGGASASPAGHQLPPAAAGRPRVHRGGHRPG